MEMLSWNQPRPVNRIKQNDSVCTVVISRVLLCVNDDMATTLPGAAPSSSCCFKCKDDRQTCEERDKHRLSSKLCMKDVEAADTGRD